MVLREIVVSQNDISFVSAVLKLRIMKLNNPNPLRRDFSQITTEVVSRSGDVPDRNMNAAATTRDEAAETTAGLHPLMRIERILEEAAQPHAHAERTVVVLPAYNVEQTLEKTVHQLPYKSIDEIILVDDGSTDETIRIARGLGIRICRHPNRRGYGAALKSCYMQALERGGDYIVVQHPNCEYDSRLISPMLDLLKTNVCDVVLGSRLRTRKEIKAAGTPFYKYAGNRMLTSAQNLVLGQGVDDGFSTFRAYRRSVLKKVPFLRNSDDAVFDSQILAQAVSWGYRIGDIPICGTSSARNFSEDMSYGFEVLKVLAAYWGHRTGIRKTSMLAAKNK